MKIMGMYNWICVGVIISMEFSAVKDILRNEKILCAQNHDIIMTHNDEKQGNKNDYKSKRS